MVDGVELAKSLEKRAAKAEIEALRLTWLLNHISKIVNGDDTMTNKLSDIKLILANKTGVNEET